MSRPRVPYLLAGFLGGGALLLGAVCDWGQASAIVAALTLADALLGALGLILAAMTGAVGILVVADVRADIASARTWQDMHTEVAVIGTLAATAPSDRVDALYVAGPQDEGLRRILLAHRFVVPIPSRTEAISNVPDRANAVAVDECDDTKLPITDLLSAADSLGQRKASCIVATIKGVPRRVSINGSIIGGGGRHCATRGTSKTRLVANAGSGRNWAISTVAESRRAPVGGLAADVIVLAHRNGSDGDLARRNVASEPATTAQPGCRGPPAGASQRQVTSGPVPNGKSFREKDQQRADTPADRAVIDNLGDRVPIGAAELEVVETYLDDVLGDLLATVASAQDHREA